LSLRGALWGRERIPTGELVALVRHLPADGAVGRAEGVWSTELELEAAGLELLDAIARLIYAQSGKRPPGKPLHVPRPGDAPEVHKREQVERYGALLAVAEPMGEGS
jgi:hypothetical protein